MSRRSLSVISLTLVWCGLWGAVSFANVASGLALSLLLSTDWASGAGAIRLRPLLKFTWLVIVDLVRSTIDVAIEILTPTDRTEEAIVAVDLPATGSAHVLLLSAAMTLSPGTAVVDVNPETGRYYIHMLHVSKLEATVAHAVQLGDLACAALPDPAAGVAS
ncbi:MAG: Na+/H+ antiporter subunit E [Acidimicrobiaceae bacterium]|nr:Na+/H+ antiporter subunit E [Acidimicrobiaceae bacterium]MCY4280926.1 Na+/H+ antiporter subunit E [Acidimicrobiaceae bacterium]MCY4294788.1 Na+/H+ antiporter subunit E [Acidimicrobiaceae bacterium]